MGYSQKLAIFLLFTSIPTIMSLKCYIGTTVGNAGSTLQECPSASNKACSITISMSFLLFKSVSFLDNHLRFCWNCPSLCASHYSWWMQVSIRPGIVLLCFWWVNNSIYFNKISTFIQRCNESAAKAGAGGTIAKNGISMIGISLATIFLTFSVRLF